MESDEGCGKVSCLYVRSQQEANRLAKLGFRRYKAMNKVLHDRKQKLPKRFCAIGKDEKHDEIVTKTPPHSAEPVHCHQRANDTDKGKYDCQ